MNCPLISVIIPTHNRAQMLCDCVESVLSANYPSVEVIVVDDCSTDDTAARISEKFADDSRVRYVRNAKNGLSAYSRNHGAQYAKGPYLLFLDDDNVIEKDMLTELVAAFKRNPDAGMIAPLTVNWTVGQRTHSVMTLGWEYNPWTSMCQ